MIYMIIKYVAIILSFNQSSYSINEDDGIVHLGLILSNPSSTEFNVQVISDDITALGKY